ncbi:FecR domain-containing protein [Sphingobacterium sp. PCS056]|uniref:FecR family protein n=1 Tax=Sphingobacterium sp. PCS056 TaxID=2931400 RepID=UPI00200E74FD|nr:FecR domain-containing protein [Sphingobacterium sp. PCS056]UPZ37985.1 FecR domain-containing protein [Sphingobacterium sp. PCS056]
MAEKEHIQKLFNRYLANTITREEYGELLNHFNIDAHAEDTRDLLFTAVHAEGLNPGVSEDTITEVTDLVHGRLHGHIAAQRTRRIRLYRWLPYAAAVVLIVAWYALREGQKAESIQEPVIATTDTKSPQDLPPGTNRASITFDNGKSIALNEDESGITSTADGISYADGKELTKLDEIRYATLITPRAGQYSLTLPDGSKIWLNSASSLRYPVQFGGAQRKVELTGEAYFEVAKNTTQPFIVVSATQQVQVLGTHFNIKSYGDEPQTITTLAEGSVKVIPSPESHRQPIIIKPNEQVINGGNTFRKQAANMGVALAWKNDQLYFEDADLSSVLREVSRWYDVDIEYQGSPDGERFTGGVKRQSNLSTMLKILRLSGVDATLKTDGNNRRLIVK